MLQVSFIRENKDRVLEGLAKRNVKNAAKLVADVLQADADRRGIQAQLDGVLADSNRLSKDIGMLFKSGERQKAELLKNKTTLLKEQSKELRREITTTEQKLVSITNSINTWDKQTRQSLEQLNTDLWSIF